MTNGINQSDTHFTIKTPDRPLSSVSVKIVTNPVGSRIMDIHWKQALGAIATIMALVSYIPYFQDIAKGKTKPHAFSWLIWALLTAIGFAGQISDSAGPGAWVTGFTALACFSIFIAALFKGEKNITKFDWSCLWLSIAAIPLWMITSTPLWSVILITVIDTVGFLPTFRKAYLKPFEETVITFTISTVKFVIAIIALTNFSVVTILYPASLVIMNGAFVVMIYMRRVALSDKVVVSR